MPRICGIIECHENRDCISWQKEGGWWSPICFLFQAVVAFGMLGLCSEIFMSRTLAAAAMRSVSSGLG
jgi:hypothetical protein